jgi:hypothetical protein
MRLLISATIFLIAVIVTASARPKVEARAERVQAGAKVDRLAWLSGCWTRTHADSLIEEHWMTPRGGSMLGMGRTVAGDKTVEYEFLRIAVVDGTLAYVARPSGQPEAAFPLKSIEDSVVVFENLAHDFPQRIIYRRNADASLTARIEGTVKGQARGRDFPYRRCQR